MYEIKSNESDRLITIPQVLTILGFSEPRGVLGYRHHPDLQLAVRVTRGLVQVLTRNGDAEHFHAGEFLERYAVGHCATRDLALATLDEYERGARATPAAPIGSPLYTSRVASERSRWKSIDATHPRGIGPCLCGLPRSRR